MSRKNVRWEGNVNIIAKIWIKVSFYQFEVWKWANNFKCGQQTFAFSQIVSTAFSEQLGMQHCKGIQKKNTQKQIFSLYTVKIWHALLSCGWRLDAWVINFHAHTDTYFTNFFSNPLLPSPTNPQEIEDLIMTEIEHRRMTKHNFCMQRTKQGCETS